MDSSTERCPWGLETRPRNRLNYVGEFETELPEGTHGVYARTEFHLNRADAVSELQLRLKYDNGFVAYLNGVKVAEENAPENAGWFSTALTTERRDSDSLEVVEFDLTDHRSALVDGMNVLALHGLNHASGYE